MKIYFYCGAHADAIKAYHDIICLAEGFEEIGVDCFGDREYYSGNKRLIRYDENVRIQDVQVVIFHYSLYYGEPNADRQILKITSVPNRSYQCVFIDAMDGVRTPGFKRGAQSCDVVLKCHFNNKYRYPENFVPWQFGLSNRILNAVHPKPFEERNNSFLVNFRVKHQLRDYVNDKIRPIVEKYLTWDNTMEYNNKGGMEEMDLLYWKQTGGRHFPSYYNRLSAAKSCACYGGVFAVPYGNYNKYTARMAREVNRIIPLFKWDRVRQWDSWRLWETWAAGCSVIHINLEKYGCVMPIMPKNGVHYIGIDLDNLAPFKEILSNPARMAEIAENGRQFVLEHYVPEKIAECLLSLL